MREEAKPDVEMDEATDSRADLDDNLATMGQSSDDTSTTATPCSSPTCCNKSTKSTMKSLFNKSDEKSACGVGFLVNVNGISSHQLLRDAETMCQRMEHRGACSCDNLTGDGAGVLTSIPHDFYAKLLKDEQQLILPPLGSYATGFVFLEQSTAQEAQKAFKECALKCGLQVIGWRAPPTDASCLGKVARNCEPFIRQVFVIELDQTGLTDEQKQQQFKCVSASRLDFEHKIFLLRKWSSRALLEQGYRFYICSLSDKLIVYKGQFTSKQLWIYFLDLQHADFHSRLALVHARFSTNTFPSWDRAHPLRLLAHNGEINTLRGNVNLMRAREGLMKSTGLFDEQLQELLFPVVEPDMSDSGAIDNVLEFLLMAGQGRSLPESVITLVPEAWHSDPLMSEEKRRFYQWAACSMESWDGPALLTFTDGRYVGAILDRNGLRPSRYYQTHDGIVCMASEVGVFDVAPERIKHKGRLRPGRMLLIDTKEHVLARDQALKQEIATKRPLEEWLSHLVTLEQLKARRLLCRQDSINPTNDSKLWTEAQEQRLLQLFGYTKETLDMLLIPMARDGKEALGSMGNDAPLACLSLCQPLLYDYFKQLFAQVTNPPIDPFREKVVMSLACPVGPESNLLDPSEAQCNRLWLPQPILSKDDVAAILKVEVDDKKSRISQFKGKRLDCVYPLAQNEGREEEESSRDMKTRLEVALDQLCEEAARLVTEERVSFLVLSDKKSFNPDNGQIAAVPIPALLSLGAVHQYLLEKRLRMRVALVVESGEVREVHHVATLLGFGADAIHPWLALDVLERRMLHNPDASQESTIKTGEQIYENYCQSISTGLSKVMAKMGISTLQSYKYSQIFEAVGLAQHVMDKCFRNSASRVGGLGFQELQLETEQRLYLALLSNSAGDTLTCTDDSPLLSSHILRNVGQLHWRAGGEKHLNEPQAVAALQEAARNNSPKAYKDYVAFSRQAVRDTTLRGQLEFIFDSGRAEVPLCEVEEAKEIVKRFCTGAMSLGSISAETHQTLAIAMNRLGGKSNTGEGGEVEERYQSKARSAIKQVASGRFGVTAAYLANADELQIKMAQGAKPGEGGELPGHKVTEEIAKTRRSVAGVGLISPPPHHDIYSIEDLAELIYDLKCANPLARISVKLVSEVGVGIVAAGVAKGKAEHITISGHDGGTGASSWTGIKGAGLPWELGLSETHQVLVANQLRSRVRVQVDGQLRSAFDILVGACLGADEFAMSTAPLITLGCTMMRKCHLNTCPVGVATQDPELRKKFQGQPEHVVNYLFLLAEEVREFMSRLGFRTLNELVGRTDLLKFCPSNEKAQLLDLDAILCDASRLLMDVSDGFEGRAESWRDKKERQDFQLDQRKDMTLIKQCMDMLAGDDNQRENKVIEMEITNRDRCFGTTLSFEIARRFGESGLPPSRGNILVKLNGSAGQSLGAFLSSGITIHLQGDANDYVAKGLCGGTVAVYPFAAQLSDKFKSQDNVIVGNVCLYGATSGKAFFRGVAAERFAVRNSGAKAVVEGVGDHGCEYMTGGLIVVLGETGRNFGAGMSGGLAFVLLNTAEESRNLAKPDAIAMFARKCNLDMVDLVELLEDDDVNQIHELLVEFVELTGSLVGQELLEKDVIQKRFVKVYPKEFQKVLAEQKAAALAKELSQAAAGDVTSVRQTGAKVKDIEDYCSQGDEVTNKTPAKLDKIRGFMKYKRIKGYYRDVSGRQSDWSEVYDKQKIRDEVKVQSARCMDCGIPFCQSVPHGCPLNNLIPTWNDLVFNDNWQEATRQLLATNNFPEFTGRVCPAPCEGACVLGINAQPVAIKSIELAISEKGFEEGYIRARPPPSRTTFTVAVIGGGPAGMACAAQLNSVGHNVTLFDRQPEIGGLLMYGIPSMKLDKEVVRRRVRLLEEEGVQFRPNTAVGTDIDAKSELLDKFDAVCLATGATWPRDLDIEGRRTLKNIHFAMEFLGSGNKEGKFKGAINAHGKKVVVIGGGDTGCDCIATSLRQGATSVVSFEILPQPPPDREEKSNPWPQWPKIFRVDYGHEEVKLKFGSDPRLYETSSVRFLGTETGEVRGIETQKVEWTQVDGNWKMAIRPDSGAVVEADLVLLAMGFLGPEQELLKQLDVPADPRRMNIITAPGTVSGQQSYLVKDKVFACGDCRRGQSLVVWGIQEGRQAARQIDQFLHQKQQSANGAAASNGISKLAGLGGLVAPPSPAKRLASVATPV